MSTSSAVPEKKSGAGSNIYLAFIPWVLFSIVANHDSVAAAGVVACVAAIVIGAPSFLAGRPKILDIGGIVVFAAFAIFGLVAGHDADELSHYLRAVSAGLLALIAFASLMWVPFTEQYARESVPQEYWDSPTFKRTNYDLTLMWACVFLAMVPSHIIAGAIDTHRANTIFNWVIPVVLIVWAAKRTAAVSSAAGDRQPA